MHEVHQTLEQKYCTQQIWPSQERKEEWSAVAAFLEGFTDTAQLGEQ